MPAPIVPVTPPRPVVVRPPAAPERPVRDAEFAWDLNNLLPPHPPRLQRDNGEMAWDWINLLPPVAPPRLERQNAVVFEPAPEFAQPLHVLFVDNDEAMQRLDDDADMDDVGELAENFRRIM